MIPPDSETGGCFYEKHPSLLQDRIRNHIICGDFVTVRGPVLCTLFDGCRFTQPDSFTDPMQPISAAQPGLSPGSQFYPGDVCPAAGRAFLRERPQLLFRGGRAGYNHRCAGAACKCAGDHCAECQRIDRQPAVAKTLIFTMISFLYNKNERGLRTARKSRFKAS